MKRRVIKPRDYEPRDYPPGHFTEPVRLWFGRYWRPQIDWKASNSATATAARERGLAEGASWGTGTIPGMGSPDARPVGWM